MTTQDDNKALVRQVIEEFWSSKPGLDKLAAHRD
jgi:hypothetical protein